MRAFDKLTANEAMAMGRASVSISEGINATKRPTKTTTPKRNAIADTAVVLCQAKSLIRSLLLLVSFLIGLAGVPY